MSMMRMATRQLALVLVAATLAACAGAGQVGDILGSVLGQQQQGNQVSGAILGVDTRAQQISLQLSSGQTAVLAYDNQTTVVYQNQNYPVTSLERGDQVTARIQSTNSGGYYTDLVQVDQSVQGTGGTSSSSGENVQSLQGNVRAVDRANGWFTLDPGNGVTLTVSLPYNVRQTDLNRFQSLRSGDYVRLYGVFLNNSRVELRQFY